MIIQYEICIDGVNYSGWLAMVINGNKYQMRFQIENGIVVTGNGQFHYFLLRFTTLLKLTLEDRFNNNKNVYLFETRTRVVLMKVSFN